MALVAAAAFFPAAATAEPASGTINYQSKAGPIDGAMGGAKVNVKFDATTVKQFSK